MLHSMIACHFRSHRRGSQNFLIDWSIVQRLFERPLNAPHVNPSCLINYRLSSSPTFVIEYLPFWHRQVKELLNASWS